MTAPTADTAPHLSPDRDGAHYADGVPMTDEDLTDAQRAAIDAVRTACADITQAEAALTRAIGARTRAVQAHEDVLRAMGWRRAARIIGSVTDSTLRADARTRIEEGN